MKRHIRTAVTVDLDRLRSECERLAWDSKLQSFRTQTAIQNSAGDDNYLEGTGSRPGQTDKAWSNLRSDLVGTWWEEFFAKLPWQVYRTRIMIMQPRSCYSIHTDTSPRLHIAIKTHNQCKFIFTTPPEIVHIPADGHVYWVDTSKEHTAINASLELRWHLLMSLVNNQDH